MSEWISVEDELPRMGGWYLISTGDHDAGITAGYYNKRIGAFYDTDDNGKSARHSAAYLTFRYAATHWMPLPTPPE